MLSWDGFSTTRFFLLFGSGSNEFDDCEGGWQGSRFRDSFDELWDGPGENREGDDIHDDFPVEIHFFGCCTGSREKILARFSFPLLF